MYVNKYMLFLMHISLIYNSFQFESRRLIHVTSAMIALSLHWLCRVYDICHLEKGDQKKCKN